MSADKTHSDIEAKMVASIAEALGVAPEDVDVEADLASLGLDSIKAFALTGDLAEWLDRELSATLFWEHPTIRQLAIHLADERGP